MGVFPIAKVIDEDDTLFFLVLFLSQKKKNTFPSFLTSLRVVCVWVVVRVVCVYVFYVRGEKATYYAVVMRIISICTLTCFSR
jgi:hypothetical protein